MSVPLRDFFAAHAAAALVSRGIAASEAAKQAYDVADALMEERQFRMVGGTADEMESHAEPDWLREAFESTEQMPESERFDRPHLLDEPVPPYDDEESVEAADVVDPRWDDLADPAIDREPRWSDLPPAWSRDDAGPVSPKPGLARTQPSTPSAGSSPHGSSQIELPLGVDAPRKRTQSA
jgi:hypothetical protein